MATPEWQARIVALVEIKEAMSSLDKERLWDYRLPEVAASPTLLARAEQALGRPFDTAHRRFLEAAGGWPAFWHTVDLMTPAQLVSSSHRERAEGLLRALDAEVLDGHGLEREQLQPVAVATDDTDLFLIDRRTDPGPVLWFAGPLVDRFTEFDDFFVAMIEYHRRDLQEFAEEDRSPAGG
ncbi:MAG TPA: hypothetical protein VIA06_12760 [Candidatus Dormibacteraeota bacterium]|jgi:hypothetical protein|nr:hypothetical protein [Candidatus Dormibacteraeota bacterium]